jgi:hypothetical protein
MRKLVIHCWGGLGSQLYAWAMAEMVVKKFPRRKIEIVFHSSGVTKRYLDLKFLSSMFSMKFIDDYNSNPTSNQKPSTGHYLIKILLKKFLSFTRITLYCNTNHEFNRVKPWTLSLRGHYSYINLDVNIVIRMLFKIYEEFGRSSFKSIKQDNALSVHYRLGDLQHLENKTYIDSYDLGRNIETIITSKECKTVTVYSDDQAAAKQLLHNFLPAETTFIDSDVWNTLFNLIETNYFIGTNSKISLWAAIFRKAIDNNSWVYLPNQMKIAVEGNLLNLVDSKNTYYY